jgi:hypothetical protein
MVRQVPMDLHRCLEIFPRLRLRYLLSHNHVNDQ